MIDLILVNILVLDFVGYCHMNFLLFGRLDFVDLISMDIFMEMMLILRIKMWFVTFLFLIEY